MISRVTFASINLFASALIMGCAGEDQGPVDTADLFTSTSTTTSMDAPSGAAPTDNPGPQATVSPNLGAAGGSNVAPPQGSDPTLSATNDDGNGGGPSAPQPTDIGPNPDPEPVGNGGTGGAPAVPSGGGAGGDPDLGAAGTGMPPPGPVCGDGTMDPGEACDDGNMMNGDGCEADCTVTPVDASELFASLDNSFIISACGDQGTGYDCTNDALGCPGGHHDFAKAFQMTGDNANVYDVTIHLHGILEAKAYSGGMRRTSGALDVNSSNDGWHVGGNSTDTSYNAYYLTVSPGVNGDSDTYYLNSGEGGDERHQSYEFEYDATFPAPGGAIITLTALDNNCRMITNCGAQSNCGTGVAIKTLDDVTLPATYDSGEWNGQPRGTLTLPNGGAQPFHGQFANIRVTNVQAR